MIRSIPVFALLLFSFFCHAQNIGININTPGAPLDIRGVSGSPATFRVFDFITSPAVPRTALESFINTIAPASAAISGGTYEGGSVLGVEPVTYGVLGTAGTGTAVAGFSTSGTALRGKSPAGLALHCSGLIKLTGLGEAAGKVLTSDVDGNASWQAPLLVAHNHFGEDWTGSALYALRLTNSGPDGNGLRSIVGSTGQTIAVSGASYSLQGVGVIGSNYSYGSFPGYSPNSGVAGLSGDGAGVFGGSIKGPAIYGLKANTVEASGSVAKFENLKIGLTDAVVVVEAVDNQPAVELHNGFIKVSGTNKMAFKHVTAAGNTSANITSLTYNNQSPTDILLVTHLYNTGTGTGGSYLSKNYGVWWNGSNWTIYLEDVSSMPLNSAFNVLVFKQ